MFRVLGKIFKWLFITITTLFVILSIIPYFFSIETKELPAEYKPYENSSFDVIENTRIHYRIFKQEGDTIKARVLMIHGFSGSTFSFRNNIDTLVKSGCLVVVADMPAFGYSDKSDSINYNDSIKIKIIHELINKVDPNQRWILIGHSMGASVIGAFATRYPAEVEKLVYIDGPAFQTNGGGSGLAGTLAKYPPLLRWAEILTKTKFVNYGSINELLSSAYSQPADSSAVKGYMEPFTYMGSASAIFRMASGMGYAKVDSSVINKIPSLLIWGTNDQWLQPSMAVEFMKQNPKMEYVKINGAGHCPMETHAAEVNQAILGFINEK